VNARGAVRQYAHALYDVAHRERRVDVVATDLASVAAAVAAHAELRAVFETPMVTPRRKRALIEALMAATGDVAIEVQRLLGILADRDRLALIGEVATAYADRVMEASRITPADVVTAVPLDQAHQDALAAALGRATGRQVTVSARVDPSILGGVVAHVGSLVFDGSVVRQLERLRVHARGEA
jgi:F-type H+-transporting ATPase subunit delta